MNGAVPLIPGLGVVAVAVGLASLAVYFLVIARHPQWVRVLNGSGLLLSGFALLASPSVVSRAQGPATFDAQAMVVLLVLACLVQATAALRNRRAWDGVERRSALAEGRA